MAGRFLLAAMLLEKMAARRAYKDFERAVCKGPAGGPARLVMDLARVLRTASSCRDNSVDVEVNSITVLAQDDLDARAIHDGWKGYYPYPAALKILHRRFNDEAARSGTKPELRTFLQQQGDIFEAQSAKNKAAFYRIRNSL